MLRPNRCHAEQLERAVSHHEMRGVTLVPSDKEIEQIRRKLRKAEQVDALKARLSTPARYGRKRLKGVRKANKNKKARSIRTISGGGFETNRNKH